MDQVELAKLAQVLVDVTDDITVDFLTETEWWAHGDAHERAWHAINHLEVIYRHLDEFQAAIVHRFTGGNKERFNGEPAAAANEPIVAVFHFVENLASYLETICGSLDCVHTELEERA